MRFSKIPEEKHSSFQSEGITLTLFNFQLRAFADIMPFNDHEEPFLHWFGLTDGWYWLQMNENDEFFRYSTDLLAHWEKNYPEDPTLLPYADYYVVRLWEDILEIEDKGEEEEDEEMWETYLQATMWWHERLLDTGYLTASPHLWFWNDGHSIHGFWDNSQLCIENIPAWDA